MAKTVIANPVVSLGIDSSGFKSGLSKAVPEAKNLGAKIGQTLKGSLGSPTSFMAAAAGAAVPINAALSIASMAANAAKSILSAPVNALMNREAFQAEQSGMPISLGSDAGYSGVFARLAQTWEDTLADMMVALDRVLDFRSWIEYLRGMLHGLSVVAKAILGPLEAVKKDPEALTRSFKDGALKTVEIFENVAMIAIDIRNTFVDVVKFIRSIPGLGGMQMFSKEDEDQIKEYQKANAKNQLVNVGAMVGGRWVPRFVPQMTELPREEAIPALQELGLIAPELAKIGYEGVANVAKQARADIAKINLNQGFAPPKINADFAANISNKLIPTMQALQSIRLGSTITSDSTAIVEAVAKASIAGPGQDLEQRVALAVEEQVRQQKLTIAIQERILAKYDKMGDPLKLRGEP